MRGAYATVREVEYMGLCAGKRINDWLVADNERLVCRFRDECEILNRLRHPNIVQFLGVYFEEEERVPMLILEFLPLNLTSCIKKYARLPEEISYSILYDVALGLHFLHSQDPPIIHRDLYSNNILLASNMTAKISDLGMAKILDKKVNAQLTRNPGHTDFMPPEVMVEHPKYDVSIDEFSYGIMMIHVLSGSWPAPQIAQVRHEDGNLVGVTEAERRELFLQKIGKDHPLMDLITECISNNPYRRAHTSEIVERMTDVMSKIPVSFTNRVEMLKQLDTQETVVRQLDLEVRDADHQAHTKDSSSSQQKIAHPGKVL